MLLARPVGHASEDPRPPFGMKLTADYELLITFKRCVTQELPCNFRRT
jgi:hypothetical protein